MEKEQLLADESSHVISLRLWPGILIIILQWFARYVLPIIDPTLMIYGFFGGLIGGVAIIIWWAFFSRAPKADRWIAVAVMIVSLAAAPSILHKSIAEAGMGMVYNIMAVPVLSLTFVIWAIVFRNFANSPRRIIMIATIVLSCGVWALFRTGGLTNDFDQDLTWRWSETSEEKLLEQTSNEKMVSVSESTELDSLINWSGFRGPKRDGIIYNKQIKTDWKKSPPTELWRRPVGPGWSSFAVLGNLIYTQEQRGEEESVSCYNLNTGEPVWRHNDKARFWESNGGAGPRGTPTIYEGRVYSLGGTGILNVLDSKNGSNIWTRNAAEDTKTETPMWGYSGSPLVLDSTVYVTVSGALIAYDIKNGEIRWKGPSGGEGYSSPHMLTINGVEQILHLCGDGVFGVSPVDGKLFWEYKWSGYPILQPALTEDGDILVSIGEGSGYRRISVKQVSGNWTVEERWNTMKCKPYYSDFVIHKGYAYGIDGRKLTCVDVNDGTRKWKNGKYSQGQLFLLADQDLLLVLTEKGELTLASATPEKFNELVRIKVMKGKTWNHPVFVDDILLVRNSEEMVALKLTLKND